MSLVTNDALHRQIENELIIQLNYLLEIIKKDSELTKVSLPVMQERYNAILEDIIRPEIQKIYEDVASDVANKNLLSFYFTISDIDKIKQLTDRFKREFWHKTNRLLQRLAGDVLIQKKDPITKTFTYSPLSPLNQNYEVTSLAVDIVVISRAEIIQHKVNEVRNTLPIKSTNVENTALTIREASLLPFSLGSLLGSFSDLLRRLITPITTINRIRPPDVEHPSNSLRQLLTSDTLVKKREFYRWKTSEDEKVCPICLPLHNLRFEIGVDAFIPTPLIDTHINCRCWLVYEVEYF